MTNLTNHQNRVRMAIDELGRNKPRSKRFMARTLGEHMGCRAPSAATLRALGDEGKAWARYLGYVVALNPHYELPATEPQP